MTEAIDPAILLAAGLGTRMRPLTETRPKPLIAVGGQSLLERVVANLRAEGIARFAVNGHHHLDQMQSALQAIAARHGDAEFIFSPEAEQLLDTGGGAKKALAAIGAERAFLSNTDAFWRFGDDAPLARMRAKADAHPGAMVVLCAHPARSLGFRRSHDFCLDPLGEVTLDRGLPVIYAGVALVHASDFAGTPDTPFSFCQMQERALTSKRLYGVLLNAPWLHVGDPQALEDAEVFLARAAIDSPEPRALDADAG